MNPWTAKFLHVDDSLCFSSMVKPLPGTLNTFGPVGVCVDHDRAVLFNPLYGEDDD